MNASWTRALLMLGALGLLSGCATERKPFPWETHESCKHGGHYIHGRYSVEHLHPPFSDSSPVQQANQNAPADEHTDSVSRHLPIGRKVDER